MTYRFVKHRRRFLAEDYICCFDSGQKLLTSPNLSVVLVLVRLRPPDKVHL